MSLLQRIESVIVHLDERLECMTVVCQTAAVKSTIWSMVMYSIR
jgi:DNA-binding FrmR family transcriptional regulator